MKNLKTYWQSSLAAATLWAGAATTPALAQNDAPASTASPAAADGVSVPAPAAAPTAKRKPRPPANRYNLDPELAARYGLTSALLPPPTEPPSTKAAKLQEKLEAIEFDEIDYANVPLSEVIKQLTIEARKRDPEKKGVNFLISTFGAAAPATIDPLTGMPVARTANIGDAEVRISPPLRNITLANLLEILTRVVEPPIKYSVEEYGVIFSPDDSKAGGLGAAPGFSQNPPPQMAVRTFRVEQETLFQGIESTFGVTAGDLAKAHTPDSASDSSQARTARSKSAQNVLRGMFSELGVNLDPPKSVFYNDLTGIIMVRASVEDLDLIQAVIETLGGQLSGHGGGYGMPGMPLGSFNPGGYGGGGPIPGQNTFQQRLNSVVRNHASAGNPNAQPKPEDKSSSQPPEKPADAEPKKAPKP